MWYCLELFSVLDNPAKSHIVLLWVSRYPLWWFLKTHALLLLLLFWFLGTQLSHLFDSLCWYLNLFSINYQAQKWIFFILIIRNWLFGLSTFFTQNISFPFFILPYLLSAPYIPVLLYRATFAIHCLQFSEE